LLGLASESDPAVVNRSLKEQQPGILGLLQNVVLHSKAAGCRTAPAGQFIQNGTYEPAFFVRRTLARSMTMPYIARSILKQIADLFRRESLAVYEMYGSLAGIGSPGIVSIIMLGDTRIGHNNIAVLHYYIKYLLQTIRPNLY
jgi:hypothetical protein